MITTLIMLSLALTDQNAMTIQEFARHWLEPVVAVQEPASQRNIGPVRRYADGSWVRVCVTRYRPFRFEEFNEYAKHYPGGPNRPSEPNLAEVLAGVDDPNLASVIRSLMEKK